MAKIGLKNLKYSILDEEDKPTGGKSFGKAIDCKVSIENNNAELRGDDTIIETDYSFRKGTVSMTVDDDRDEVFAPILGHKIDEETQELIRNENDVAPYVSLARMITKMVGGEYKYKVEYLAKVKFSEPSQEDLTKGENVEFKTAPIEGTVMTPKTGNWSKSKTFTNKAEAEEYLDSLLANQ